MAKRTISTEFTEEDARLEPQLCGPSIYRIISGQQKIKDNLSVYIQAAKQRNALDHVLFIWTMGLGEKPHLPGLLPTKWA